LNRFTDYNIFNATGAKRLNDVTNINIKDLKITDSKATTFSPLEFTFSIESKNKDVVKGIELAIGISSITKVPLLLLYSSHMGKRFSIKPGINTIKVKIKSIPLTPGVYSCNLWLGKGQVPIDWIQDCFILNVEASKESKGYIENRGYPIILESFWDYN